jgi:hypothetical protein
MCDGFRSDIETSGKWGATLGRYLRRQSAKMSQIDTNRTGFVSRAIKEWRIVVPRGGS